MSTSCGIVLKRTEYIVLVYKGRNEGKVMDFVVNNGGWDGFKAGTWQKHINVRDFILLN